LGIGMNLGERKIPKYKTQDITQQFLDLFDYVVRLSTKWALIIAVLNQSYGRRIWTLNMITALITGRVSLLVSISITFSYSLFFLFCFSRKRF
jgi:hypothetical protein